MMYVEFMKNFLLANSSDLMAVRLILTSWAQKRLIPTFETWCTSSSWKILISPIRASWWLLESFRHPGPKNVWFPLSRHDVRRVHEKFSSLGFEQAIGYKTRFDLLSPKTFFYFIFIYKLCQIWPVIPTELIAPLTGYLNLSTNNIYKIVVIRCPQKDNRISEIYETACPRDRFLYFKTFVNF